MVHYTLMAQYDSRAKKRNQQIGYMNFAQRLFRSVYPCANRDWHHPRFIQMSPISLWDPEPWIWAAQTFGALRIPLIADKSGPTWSTHPELGSCTGRVWNCRSSTPKPASTSSAQIENRTSDWKRNEIEEVRSTRSWCVLCKAVPRTMKYEDQQSFM